MIDGLTNWIKENSGDFEEVGALNGDRWHEFQKCKDGGYISVDELINHLKENELVVINTKFYQEILLTTLYGVDSRNEDFIETKLKLALPVIASLSNK